MSKPRKPTGTTGPFEVTFGESKATVTWQTASFSSQKEEIEAGVAEGFLREVDRQQLFSFTVNAVRQNLQNDLDFTLETSEGGKYLELMEIAPLTDNGGRYDEATGSYNPYDRSSGIMSEVLKKSRRYRSTATDTPILLVVYNTHWAFDLGDTALMLLQYFAQATEHCFERIYFYRPSSERSGTAYDVFPTPPEHWAGFNPEVCRDDVAYNLIPAAIEVCPEGGAAIPLTPRPTRTRAKSRAGDR